MILHDMDGSAQACSNSIANALELLQSCTKPSIYYEPVLLQYGLTQPTVAYYTPLAKVVQRSNFEKTADIGELLAVGER